MQMAQLEPSRSVINALMLVFENAGLAKQVCRTEKVRA